MAKKVFTPEELKEIQDKGGKVTTLAKKVEGSFDVPGLESMLRDMMAQQKAQQDAQNAMVLGALNELIDTIRTKPMKGDDLAPLVEEIRQLRKVMMPEPQPMMDFELDIKRDQRGLLETGTRFIAIPKVVN